MFLAESPAGAMLEILVHLPFKNGTLPAKYTLLKIAVPDGFGMAELNPSVRGNWRKRPDVTQRLGDAWLSSADTSLARVPSAVIPQTWNVLLNPEHTDARQIRIEAVIREQFDNRLFRLGVY